MLPLSLSLSLSLSIIYICLFLLSLVCRFVNHDNWFVIREDVDSSRNCDRVEFTEDALVILLIGVWLISYLWRLLFHHSFLLTFLPSSVSSFIRMLFLLKWTKLWRYDKIVVCLLMRPLTINFEVSLCWNKWEKYI